jgi:cation diffusion facilitator family transporter
VTSAAGPVTDAADADRESPEGLRLAGLGLLFNAALAVIKGIAGILGHSYALLADAVESAADVGGSLVVWGGLRVAARSADASHPYGHGKAEPLAAAAVGLMLCGGAVGIMIRAVQQIIGPRRAPAAFTLVVLIVAVVVKIALFRVVSRAAASSGSGAMLADAWHHRADLFTSSAAFVGISTSVLGGPGWEWCDGAAAVVASLIVFFNGWRILRGAIHELMDGNPDPALIARVAAAAGGVDGVRLIEQLKARKFGTRYLVDLHVQADPMLSLHDAHVLSGRVKGAIRASVPTVEGVLVHMEPFEAPVETGAGTGADADRTDAR